MSDAPWLPATIWLSPACDTCRGGVDRTWCEEPQEECVDCGMPWTAYKLTVEEVKRTEAERAEWRRKYDEFMEDAKS